MSRFPTRIFPEPSNFAAFQKELFNNRSLLRSLLGSTGSAWYVNPSTGSDGNNDGKSLQTAFDTLTYALTKVSAGDVIFLAPGQYDESALIVVPIALNNLTIVGLGGRGAAYIEPSTEDQSGLEWRANDGTLINVGVAGEDETSAFALKVFGKRFRAYGCKFEGGLNQVIIGPATIAQQDAGTHEDAADGLFEDCEICWGTNGIVVTSSDYGACTQLRIKNCYFHNLTGDQLDENDAGVIGAGRNVIVEGCIFGNDESNAAPTKYVDADSAGYTGALIGNKFVTTVHAASLIALAAGVLYVGNFAQAEGPATGGGTSGRPD